MFRVYLLKNVCKESLQTSSNNPDTFQQLEFRALNTLSQALTRLKDQADDPKRPAALQQLAIAYNACRNALPDFDKPDKAQGLNYIIDELGGWPTMDKDWEAKPPKSEKPFALAVSINNRD